MNKIEEKIKELTDLHQKLKEQEVDLFKSLEVNRLNTAKVAGQIEALNWLKVNSIDQEVEIIKN